MNPSRRDTITAAIQEMPVVNSHEHCWRSFSRNYGQEYDLAYFLDRDYLEGDLLAAGMPLNRSIFDYLNDPDDRDGVEDAWRVLRPYLDRVRSTAYFRYLVRGLNELFDVREADIFSGDWRGASDHIRAFSKGKKGQGAELSQRMGAIATLMDAKIEPELIESEDFGNPLGIHRLLHVARLDMFIHEQRGLAATLGQHSGLDFDSWLDAFDRAFHRNLEAGVVGFKSGLAYNRRIEYGDPPIGEAAQVYRSGVLNAAPYDKTLFQDFMVNRLCRLCLEADVPLQVHTGIQGGIRHVLEDSKPTLLTELLLRFPELRVDLFHGGFPWYIQGGLMAKYFPNVVIDGCWMHHISPSAFHMALTSWIETVPTSKILAWGGDHTLLEHSFASLCVARELITDVLTELVDRGYFDVDLALETARRILYANAVEFWRIPDTRSVP